MRILSRWTRHDCLKISIHRGSEVPSLTPAIRAADAPLSRPCCPVLFVADSWLFPDVWQLWGEFLFGTWVRLPRNSLLWQFSFRRTFAGDTYCTMPEIHHVGFAVITTVSVWMCIFITHSEKATTQVMQKSIVVYWQSAVLSVPCPILPHHSPHAGDGANHFLQASLSAPALIVERASLTFQPLEKDVVAMDGTPLHCGLYFIGFLSQAGGHPGWEDPSPLGNTFPW